MSKQSSSSGKIKGLYLRGNIFWLTHGSGQNRVQMSLETSDEIEAIEKARKVIADPQLNTSNGYLAEVAKYTQYKLDKGTWTVNSKSSKELVLQMFGEALEYKDIPLITTRA